MEFIKRGWRLGSERKKAALCCRACIRLRTTPVKPAAESPFRVDEAVFKDSPTFFAEWSFCKLDALALA